MDVVARREQQRHEHRGAIRRQAVDDLVDSGILDVDMTEHHLVDQSPGPQIVGHGLGERFDEGLTQCR